MSPSLIWIATSLVVFFSSGIQRMTRFGFAVLAMPLLVLLQDPRQSVGTSMLLLGDKIHDAASQAAFATLSLVVLGAAGALCVAGGVAGFLSA